MKKFRIYVGEEVLQENLTLLQATRMVNKLKKMYKSLLFEIEEQKEN